MTVNKESLANLIKAVESGEPLGEAEKAALAEISEKAKSLEKPNVSTQSDSVVKQENPNENLADNVEVEKAKTQITSPDLNSNPETSTNDVLQLLHALQEASLYKDNKSSDAASALLESLSK